MIDDYKLVYSITALPNILFANMTSASQPLTFDSAKFTIPQEIKGVSIELRIYLFNPNGILIEMSSIMLPASAPIICQTAEFTGLKLVDQLIKNLD